jgi:hypothetical protein
MQMGRLSKYQKLGKAIEPKLSEDGENFPDWRASLENTVRVVFEVWGYFDDTEVNTNSDWGKLTSVLIETSVHATLLTLVRGKTGRAAFQLLRGRFETVSWSYIMTKWMKATEPFNPSAQLNSVHSQIEQCLDEIIRRTGPISKDMILACLFHQQCQVLYQDIANALDAWLAVNQLVAITSKTLLELAGCFESGSVSTGLVFAYREKALTVP